MTSTQFEVRGQDYSRIILPLARQERSLLYDRVYVKSDITGKCFYQDQIGKWEMSAKTTVNPDTPQNDPNLSRTRIDIGTYNDARMLDRSLRLQEFSDPMSETSYCISSAVGIQMDKLIYDALGGVAHRGETGATSVTFPAGKVVAADFLSAGTNTGLTTTKIRRAKKLLDAQGVPTYDRTFVCSATGLEQLLGTTVVTNSDYNSIRALVAGELDTWLGFKFVVLPDGIIKVDSNNIADYFAFHKTGICFGMLEELFLRVEERADKSYSKQIYYEINAGAGRLEEAKVIKVKSDESVIVTDERQEGGN
jgi:hypothetical protein